jgi:hypothetical protein
MICTGSPHPSWVSTRPRRPGRAPGASRSASQAIASGSGATAHLSMSRGAAGLVQRVVAGTVTYARLHMGSIVTRARGPLPTRVSDRDRMDDQRGPRRP